MKPLISYYGGKQRIASKIVPHLQAIAHTVRCVPFAGGLGVFYAWPRPHISNGHHYREVINDIDRQLITLYRWARNNPAEFDRMIQFTPYSQSEHQEAIRILKSDQPQCDRDIAWAYYVNIQQSFANNLNKGWGRCVYSQNLSVTWNNHRQRIPVCLERLQDVHIACDDAIAVIKQWDSPQTLFYLDPPYPSTDQGHYDGYTIADWQQLCDTIDAIEGSYVLSNYAQEVEPTSAQQRIEITAHSSASGQGKVMQSTRSRKATADELGDRRRTEVLWVCDRSAAIRPELRAIAHRVGGQLQLFG